ncbi:cell division protein CrgA [Corynebacterium heidelbergense]|uniref:Cell division protein CrgA n=1 Tax=Corynebacterium heidelbergense TaxID=2055947 RepID=A0A364VBB1_9CORY|nr:cell division protein CrgA [Corynebacterium heidelbergense]RAV33935.1 cell division protein CrgA [Corynebacterium heidelbergense]WCZ35612.1 Cell division protein CrgA [Corynebacterium heidelbergense]
MPKAKVNTGATAASSKPSSTPTNRTPVKLNATGTPRWYIALMIAFWIVGLAWLVVNYIAGPSIPFMVALGPWNYLIGFGLFIIGLLMTMGWK